MGEGSYITFFSPSDVTAFHRMKYGGGGVITLFSPSDFTAFHIIPLNAYDTLFLLVYLVICQIRDRPKRSIVRVTDSDTKANNNKEFRAIA